MHERGFGQPNLERVAEIRIVQNGRFVSSIY